MPKSGSPDGVIVANGGVSTGYTLFIKNSKPTYEYNWFTQARYKIRSSKPVKREKNVIKVDFKYDGGLAKGGTVALYLNDKKVSEGRVDKTVLARFSADETFDTGFDSASPVRDEYKSPFPFAGTIEKVEIDIEPSNLSAENLTRIEVGQLLARFARE